MRAQNGDLLEFLSSDNGTYFMFYMDGSLYHHKNHTVVKVDGYNGEAVRIIRPRVLRNSLDCFVYGEPYDTDYAKCGGFDYYYLSEVDKRHLVDQSVYG